VRREDKRQPVIFEGEEYPHTQALIRHLATVTGHTEKTIWHRYVQLNSDAAAVIAHYREKDLDTRAFDALVAETGLSAAGCRVLLARFNTPHRVLQHLGHRPLDPGTSRAELLHLLMELSGQSLHAVRQRLKQLGDPQRVLRHYAERTIEVNGRFYAHKLAFYTHIHRHYGSSVSSAQLWHARGMSWAEIEEHARELQHQAGRANAPRQPLTLLGWEFRSFSGACTYYRMPNSQDKRMIWHANCAKGLLPVVMFGDYVLSVPHTLLDARGRYYPEFEAPLRRRRPTAIPRNVEPHPVTDSQEVLILSILAVRAARAQRST
jgi:hypothetical protein